MKDSWTRTIIITCRHDILKSISTLIEDARLRHMKAMRWLLMNFGIKLLILDLVVAAELCDRILIRLCECVLLG